MDRAFECWHEYSRSMDVGGEEKMSCRSGMYVSRKMGLNELACKNRPEAKKNYGMSMKHKMHHD